MKNFFLLAQPYIATATMELLVLLTTLFLVAHCDHSRPNVVFMMADDFGYGDTEYNGGIASTPQLNEMASSPNSIRLDRYYSGGPVCSPTRGTVLTGRNHNRYCVWTANAGNNCDDFKCPENKPLPLTEVTIADLLVKAGYTTAMFGKWHLGDFIDLKGNPKWPVSHPGKHGFQEWWATERSAPTVNINCACFDKNLCVNGHYNGPPPCTNYYTIQKDDGSLVNYSKPENGDDDHFIATQFENFLKDHSKEPFFAYLPFHNVHIRYLGYEGYIEKYAKAGYDLDHIDYYAAISALDDAVGRVRNLLKQYNISENTMLWFTSDNGPAKGTPGSASFLRGRKGELYEGGIRVPGIIEWPTYIKKNRASNYTVVSSDLMPTVCDMLDIKCPSDRPIDGKSIMPLLKGEKDTRNSTMAWMYNVADSFESSYNAVISGDQFKLFASYNKGKMVSAQLYDLLNDRSESKDISSENKDMFDQLKNELEDWRSSVIHSATKVVDCMEQ